MVISLPIQRNRMYVCLRLLLISWLFTRALCGAVRVELQDGEIITVDDEKSITPTVDSQPGDPIFGALTRRDLFGRQYCSAPGQNVICGNGCCPNNNYCCENASCLDVTSRICCPNGRQCYAGGFCCSDGNCVSKPHCSCLQKGFGRSCNCGPADHVDSARRAHIVSGFSIQAELVAVPIAKTLPATKHPGQP